MMTREEWLRKNEWTVSEFGTWSLTNEGARFTSSDFEGASQIQRNIDTRHLKAEAIAFVRKLAADSVECTDCTEDECMCQKAKAMLERHGEFSAAAPIHGREG